MRCTSTDAVYDYFYDDPRTSTSIYTASNPNRSETHASKLRFHSGVVRIRSSTSVCLLHGLVLLPCGISVAGPDDTSAGDATELRWDLIEDLSCCYVLFLDDQ
ncbi:hypothetical protein VPH35_092893 [Triticum aestivum]